MPPEPAEPPALTPPSERERARMALSLGALLGAVLALLGRRAARE